MLREQKDIDEMYFYAKEILHRVDVNLKDQEIANSKLQEKHDQLRKKLQQALEEGEYND